VKDAP